MRTFLAAAYTSELDLWVPRVGQRAPRLLFAGRWLAVAGGLAVPTFTILTFLSSRVSVLWDVGLGIQVTGAVLLACGIALVVLSRRAAARHVGRRVPWSCYPATTVRFDAWVTPTASGR